MQRAKRRKRASVGDLYKTCALGGDCIPDVKNKVEGTTLADILLKAFGSILYLGNLGIGTGRGTGGQYGYNPFGGASRPSISNTPIRPTIPVEGINPIDVLPVDPTAPAIVPLSEGLPDTAVIDIPGAGPGLPTETLDVTTVIDELSEVTGVGERPNIVSTTDDAAQLDIQVEPPPATRVIINSTTDNTNTEIVTHASHVNADYNVFVDAQMHGINIGPIDTIELQEINLRDQFEIEEGPVHSTPLSERFITRAKELYNKYTTQVPTRHLSNVTGPRLLFEFQNPAFDSDVINVFNRDVQALAGSSDLQNVATLGDIRVGETSGRTVRVSRVGHRLGLTTRSGRQATEPIHLYYDVSPIATNTVELQTFTPSTINSTLVDALQSTSFINVFEEPIPGSLEFADTTLLDTFPEDFGSSQLVITSTESNGDIADILLAPAHFNLKVFSGDYGNDILVYHPIAHGTDIVLPSNTFMPVHPAIPLTVEGADFSLHPSLQRRKRKRPSF